MKKNKISIVKAFNYSLYLLRENYWQIIWPIFILGCIESIQIVTSDYFFLIPLVVNFLRVALLYSIVKYMLNLAERKNCNWSELFLSQNKYLSLFYYSGVVFIIFKLGLLINNLLGIALIDKLFLIVAIYLWIRFYFSAFFIVDHGVNLFEGFKLSYRITDGAFFKMTIFFIVFILVNLTGIIIIIIGRWILTYPVILGVSIYMYQKLIDNSELDNKYKSENIFK